jgi:hypothetical protein
VVMPPVHEYVFAPLALKVALLKAHSELLAGAITSIGKLLVTTATVMVLEQPNAFNPAKV